MNVLTKFYEIPSMFLEVIKETKRYGHTVSRPDMGVRSFVQTDNVNRVYPPSGEGGGEGGYKKQVFS